MYAQPATVGPTFSATRITSTQSLTSGTPAKVQLNNVAIDTGGYWNAGTFVYQPLVSGTYAVSGSVYCTSAGLTNLEVSICKNGTTGGAGTEVVDSSTQLSGISNFSITLPTRYVSMNGTTDTLELDVIAVGTSPVVQSVRSTTQMSITRIGP